MSIQMEERKYNGEKLENGNQNYERKLPSLKRKDLYADLQRIEERGKKRKAGFSIFRPRRD